MTTQSDKLEELISKQVDKMSGHLSIAFLMRKYQMSYQHAEERMKKHLEWIQER